MPTVRLLPAAPSQPRLVAHCRDSSSEVLTPRPAPVPRGDPRQPPQQPMAVPAQWWGEPTSGAVRCGSRWWLHSPGRAPGGRGGSHGLVGILVELSAARPGPLRGGEHSMGHRFGRTLDGAEQGFPRRSWGKVRMSGASQGAQPSPWAPTTSQGIPRGQQGPAGREEWPWYPGSRHSLELAKPGSYWDRPWGTRQPPTSLSHLPAGKDPAEPPPASPTAVPPAPAPFRRLRKGESCKGCSGLCSEPPRNTTPE